MGSITFQLMIITLVSKFTGLLRESVFGAAFGTSMIKDVYVTSETITALLFSFLFVSVQSIFIPLYNRVLNNKDRKNADLFTSNFTNVLLVISVVIVIVAVLLMDKFVSIVAAGYTGEKFETAVYFTRIRMFGIFFSAANACMISYLNIYNDFRTPAFTGIISNIVLINVAIISAYFQSIELLVGGTILSVAVQYIMFPRALKKVGYNHKLYLDFKDNNLKHALALALPVMFSIVVNDVSIIIDQTIASSIVTDGGVSALDYAQKIYQIIYGIVIVSIVTAAYPRMSKLAQSDKIKEMKSVTVDSITMGLILIIPATIGLMLFAEPVVRLFYERRAFTAESTMMTAGALFWYAPGLIALIFTNLLNRVFYSLGDTKTPVVISIIQVAIDVVLNITLSRLFGLNGLAASTAIGNWFAAFAYLIFIRRRLGNMQLTSMFTSTVKISMATVVMALIAFATFTYLPIGNEVIRLVLAILAAAITYGITVLLLRVPEVEMLKDSLLKKFKRNK